MIGAVEGGRATGRTRVVAIVALAAAAAVAVTIGTTLIQTRGESTTAPGAVTKPRAGAPPLWLDFGVRSDAQARALAGAQALYTNGRRAQAGTVFARYDSLEAQIGAAFSRWPNGTLDDLKHLVASHPLSSLVLLHFGWALYWSGRNADAIAAWQRAAAAQPDSPAAVDAQTALHPTMALRTAVHRLVGLAARRRREPPGRRGAPGARARRGAAGREREAPLRHRALESPPPRVGRAPVQSGRRARASRPRPS